MAEHIPETRDGTTYHEALDAIKFLSNAVSKFEDNEEDIFKILIQISSISGNFLPYNTLNGNLVNGPDEILITRLEPLIRHLSKHFIKKYKQYFASYLNLNNDESANKIQHLPKSNITKSCMCIEKLCVLCGVDETLSIIKNTALRCMENLSQYHLEYFSNPYNEIQAFESKLQPFIQDAKLLAIDTLEVLCMSDIVNKSLMCSTITESILIRVQSEVMMLINSTLENLNCEDDKKSLNSESDAQSECTSQSSNVNLKQSMSLETLSSFCCILQSMLDFEKSLKCFKLLKIVSGESDESTITREKSALKNHSGLSDVFSDHNKFRVLKSTAAFGTWNWHESWKDLRTTLSTSISEIILEQSKKTLRRARELYLSEKYKITTVDADNKVLLVQSENQPKTCIDIFVEILNLFRVILPLAVFGMQYKPMLVVTNCFEESVADSLKDLKTFLNDIVTDVPEKCSLQNLYTVISTCEAVCMNLDFFGRCIQGDEERCIFQGTILSYSELCTKTKGIVKHLLISNTVNRILHDPESHNWSDHRDFSDGESCSHSLIVWNLELPRTWRNLSDTVSEKSRQEIFSQLLMKSLNCLTNRYARCKPSYNRTKQVRRDILVIFTITYNYIWNVTSDPTHLFQLDINDDSTTCENSQAILADIHSSCQNLLATLTFLTSPISVLNDALNNSDEIEDCKCFSWLHIVSPVLFTKSWNASLYGMSETAVSYSALNLVPLHESQSLTNAIFALIVNDGFLAKACFGGKNEIIVLEDDVKKILCSNLLCVFSSSRFTIFDDNLFTNCLLQAIGNDIRFLTKEKFDSKENDGIYHWKKYVRDSLEFIVKMTLQRVVEYCVNYTWTNVGSGLLSLIPESLQMEMMNLNERTSSGMKGDDENAVLLCLVLIVQGIRSVLHTLPSWLVNLFVEIDHRLGKQRKSCLFKLFGAQVIINFIESSLIDVKELERELNLNIRNDTALMLKKISEHLKNLCENNEILNGDENLKRILLSSLDDIKSTFKHIFSQNLRHEDLGGNARIFNECVEFVHALQLHGNDENKQILESLKNVKNTVVKFIPALKRKHNFGTILAKESNNVDTNDAEQETTFNSLQQIKKIGSDKFDQDIIANHELDYAELVTGHVEQGGCLKQVVTHRWDMQSGACLQDEEISSVSNVKNILNIT